MDDPQSAPKPRRPWWHFGCFGLVLSIVLAGQIFGLLSILSIIAATLLGDSLDALFSQLSSAVDSAAQAPPPSPSPPPGE